MHGEHLWDPLCWSRVEHTPLLTVISTCKHFMQHVLSAVPQSISTPPPNSLVLQQFLAGFYSYMPDPRQSIKEMKDRLRNEGRPEQISYTFEKGGTPAIAQWTCTYWMDGNRVESGYY
ncbi:hypothetical protein FS842_009223 [Serendipita sp. 407]|nr:hypothetical protein FS842_009223 [Serendipita sp. 407]